MRKDKNRLAERILIFLGGILVGVALVTVSHWEIEPKLSAGDLLIAIVTVLLAWIVSVLLERAKSTDTALNGLLLTRVEEIRQLFRETHALAQRQEGQIWSASINDEIVATLRKISIHLSDLELLTGEVFDTDLVKQIKEYYLKYKRVLTSTNATSPLIAERMEVVEKIYENVRSCMTEIIIQICRR